MWLYYKEIGSRGASASSGGATIDKRKFQDAMQHRSTHLLDRVFTVFDLDKDGDMLFNEFISILSVLSPKATPEQKIECTFITYTKLI